MPNQANNGISEEIFSPSDISNINNNLDKLTNNVNELVNKISEKEKRELEEEKRIKEEKEKLSKEQEKEEKAYQEEKEEFLQQITLLVENSDQQETFTSSGFKVSDIPKPITPIVAILIATGTAYVLTNPLNTKALFWFGLYIKSSDILVIFSLSAYDTTIPSLWNEVANIVIARITDIIFFFIVSS